MAIETRAQTLFVDGITSVSITDIQQDDDSGLYIREVRIFGTPTVGGPAPQVLVLRLGAVQRTSIAIVSPESNF
jgi:voltage-gated potassium channel Kch